MAELADAYGSGPYEGNFMQVQVLLPAPNQSTNFDTKTALHFGGLFLRLCPESLDATGFPGFLHFRGNLRPGRKSSVKRG